MILGPAQKNLALKAKNQMPFFSRPANNNRPPKRNFFGWLCFLVGVLLSLGTFFWLYEKMI